MKFYKVINEYRKHHGFQYQDGLNIDTVPFAGYGCCERGGLYYSREDIFAFFSYGVYIVEVEIPEDAKTYAEIYGFDRDPAKWKSDKIIIKNEKRICEDVIKELIEEGANVAAMDYYILSYACRNGLENIVKLILELPENLNYPLAPFLKAHKFLQEACFSGNLNIVKMLENFVEINPQNKILRTELFLLGAINGRRINVLQYFHAKDPELFKEVIEKHCISELEYQQSLLLFKEVIRLGVELDLTRDTLFYSVTHGTLGLVQFLIDYGFDVHANDDSCIKCAAKYGDDKMVKLLLKNGARREAENEQALRYACYYNKPEVVKLLIEDGADVSVGYWAYRIINDESGPGLTQEIIDLLVNAKTYREPE